MVARGVSRATGPVGPAVKFVTNAKDCLTWRRGTLILGWLKMTGVRGRVRKPLLHHRNPAPPRMAFPPRTPRTVISGFLLFSLLVPSVRGDDEQAAGLRQKALACKARGAWREACQLFEEALRHDRVSPAAKSDREREARARKDREGYL